MQCITSVSLKRVLLKRCDTDTGRFIASYRIVSSLETNTEHQQPDPDQANTYPPEVPHFSYLSHYTVSLVSLFLFIPLQTKALIKESKL
ncbi:hypothetical protein PGT21_036133 [Puccinia graminis f. sp. tritici]|uniref:Uncharacterized protein n=1 Tax=Puccinia graminis f. sp. tritici TaxID=56615 RepID=A0A5B0Q053_PUCGR|nr:hypothetical protein PGT21_036133 [Puccinia graminis f. sp. tritici]